jgi:hypothetical protein
VRGKRLRIRSAAAAPLLIGQCPELPVRDATVVSLSADHSALCSRVLSATAVHRGLGHHAGPPSQTHQRLETTLARSDPPCADPIYAVRAERASRVGSGGHHGTRHRGCAYPCTTGQDIGGRLRPTRSRQLVRCRFELEFGRWFWGSTYVQVGFTVRP